MLLISHGARGRSGVARRRSRATITVEDVLNSRMTAHPFRLLQYCVVTDGGGASILVAAERARDFPQKPVYLLGTGKSVETPMVSQMEDFTSSRVPRRRSHGLCRGRHHTQ
jgi:acetyl-CoA acetyltransferase